MMDSSSSPSSPVAPSPLVGGSFPLALRKLIENPPKNFLEERDVEKDKTKLDKDDDYDSIVASASLMPPIWDKTIPYDGESFHLEYMDLDEFLLENGISSNPTQLARAIQDPLMSVADLESDIEPASTLSASPLSPSVLLGNSEDRDLKVDSKAEEDPPSPVEPEKVEVEVNFNPDPTDLLLSTVPGEELFDPRKHKFAEEELKPQPMVKKAKKIYVPEDLKDEKYWNRRKKNNVAAKRSREARRLKENQITVRAAFLEKENTALRSEVADLRKELGKSRNIISKYEKQFGLFDFNDSE
ncbi:thyrotrophic embryonic factor S homeolog [Xenopus laevis]|uniref:LOC494759 protein n=2 Tax=Xenopus laevis TaxID=8355 RepID=Q63ZP9_XENLA|nr:thyrotrophic embryonic factor S homeolog [Xenopus laevis]AAH82861.1 LOC494759 protein [Xenopus laevis]OCT83145.1 hypothetical protein XELAEV_18025682mg [Xenopus laevis]